MDIHAVGGSVSPRWEVNSDSGYSYSIADRGIDRSHLQTLGDRGFLEPLFMDRISRCCRCMSHALNMREVCVSCKSPHITSVDLLHHYRCGYVAPMYEFVLEANGRRCPKCSGLLRDRGTDHDVPGPQFHCQDCDRAFQMPEVGGICLQCGVRSAGADMERIVFEDVVTFKLTSQALDALRGGQDRESNSGAVGDRDSLLSNNRVFLAFLDDEYRRQRQLGSKFYVVLANAPSIKTEDGALRLREIDKVGLAPDGRLAVLLPSCELSEAQRVARVLANEGATDAHVATPDELAGAFREGKTTAT